MTVPRIGLMAAIAFMFLAHTASGQDTPKVGVTMGYPSSIGVIWHLTDGVAIRPEVSVAKSSGEFTTTTSFSFGGTTTTNTSVSTTETWQVGAGFSALFYVSTHDALRTYVSPRWTYTRLSSDSSSSLPQTGTAGHANFVSASFGAQYALGRRFGVFGEIGLGFSRTVTTPTPSTSSLSPGVSGSITGRSSSSTLGTRSAAGVVWYF
jgi:hypothetical protein